MKYIVVKKIFFCIFLEAKVSNKRPYFTINKIYTTHRAKYNVHVYMYNVKEAKRQYIKIYFRLMSCDIHLQCDDAV